MYNVLSSYRLSYVQFKEVNILWDPGAGSRGPDDPNTLEKLLDKKDMVNFKI